MTSQNPRIPRRLRWGVAATLTAATLVLSGCGSGSPSAADGTASGSAPGPDPAGSGELTEISVGTIAIASSTELRYGVAEGIFQDHGLDVELVEGQGGAALLPAVQTRATEFAVGNPMSVLTAADQGLPMKIVSGYSWSSPGGEDINAVIARKDSGITDFVDLQDQTVSVNAVHTLGDLSIMEATERAGGDPARIKFNEMPFPDMLAQLEQGNVDAVWLPEPFLSRALADPENVVVGYPNQEVMDGMPLTIAFTSEGFAEEQPQVVDAFRDALNESAERAAQDEDGVRAMLPEFLKMDEATAQTIKLEPAHTDLPVEKMQTIYDLMLKYGMADNPLDVESLYVQQ
ncbi:ABC transporter substrate-binding protein [Citricoccus sp.]|uniref:ABC transporter substrate-binding protein n=1 Tax=Citricoccus sp. TaxID=1978372 RepID=UPI002CDD7C5A|nr:ABC transporter substrate-binding protein [Citricoccus sp.]HRO95208.1 ABC transporter substrate-binding protein [Citricoccus sp.]